MKRSRFSEKQIIGVLREHQAGPSAAELCRKHGASEPTFYKWRSRYGGMEGEPLSAFGPRTMASDAKRLKALKEENAKLKRLLAESMLDVSTLREMFGKNL
jgi:putative transposase